MGLVLDLIVVAIILLFVISSAKKGFVNVLVESVGFVAAILIAFTISTPLANATYDKIIAPSIVSAATADGTNAEWAEENIWDSLPRFITENAEKIGLNREDFNEKITANIGNGVETAVTTASDAVIKPVVTRIISVFYSVILVILLLVVVKFLAKLLNGLFSFSIIGKLNRFLGGVIGILKGTVIALVFCMAVSLIIAFTENGFLIFTSENIASSHIFKFLIEIPRSF